jgi:penicillin-binding protein 2
MYRNSGNRDEKLSGIKLAAVQYGILVIMLVLVAGLWRLQVLNVDNFKQLAEQNRVRQVPILAPRGKLFDRNGNLLVDNYPSVSCFLARDPRHDTDADLPLIARGLNLDLNDLRTMLEKYRSEPGYRPILIKQDITPDEQAFVASHSNELPELETIEVERRLYPANDFAANLIGYVGELSERDLNTPQYAFYEPGDVVGKAGVERAYDQILRGQDGSRDMIVDSHGREVGYLGTEHAVPGHDLKLTIDNDIQRAAELALGDRQGAIVAMDPRNGEILAMVSHPSFDPNQFSVRISRGEWNKLITDPDHPLMNKAIQAQLAPGSTFKILMSVAGLQQGIAQNLRVMCNGGADFYGHYFHCDRHHGMENIDTAIPDSCDTYFYTLADKLGIDNIDKYADEFGFGQKTGIDLPDEEEGLMPSAEWVLHTLHHKWYAGETISVGIGQGAIQVTPIQLARYIAGVASDGHMVRPHVVFPDQLPPYFRKEIQQNYPGTGNASVPISEDTWMTVTNAMAQVTEPGPFHTAVSAHLNGIDLAGKTGTAQTMSHAALERSGLKGRDTLPNVWFVGVVPRRNPHFVVAVLWMHGDFSYYAGRIGARVVAAYVDKQRRLDHNLPMEQAQKPQGPVEVGAVWSAPAPDGTHPIHGGHYVLDPGSPDKELAKKAAGAAPSSYLARRPASMTSSSSSPAVAPSELGAIVADSGGKER